MKFRLRVLSRPISTRSAPATGRCCQHQPRCLLQPPPCPVPDDGIADLLGHREAQPNRQRIAAGQAPEERPRRPRPSCRRTPRAEIQAAALGDQAFRRGLAERLPRSRSVEAGMVGTPAVRASGGQLFAALGAAVGQHLATADGLHAGAKSVPALADQLGRLIGALHDCSPKPN